MPVLGPNYPDSGASLANAGTSENAEAWVSPGNVISDNATDASITAATYDNNDISQILVASDFDFTIPTGAVINGITVEIERNAAAGSARDFRVQLATGTTFATLVGDNKATATAWPAAKGVATYGGASDTWNAGLTVAQLNAVGFSVFLSAQATGNNTDIAVDYIRVSVTYGVSNVHAQAQARIKNTYRGHGQAQAEIPINGSKVYPLSSASDLALGGTLEQAASLSAGSGVTVATVNTQASGTNINFTNTAGGTVIDWYTAPLTGVTITGTVIFNVWAAESNAAANTAARVVVDRVSGVGAYISTIAAVANGFELPVTTRAAQNWSTTPTNTTLNTGDRLHINIQIDAAGGTMAAGHTATLGYSGGTGAADGDTWVQFTETITESATPTERRVHAQAQARILDHIVTDPFTRTTSNGWGTIDSWTWTTNNVTSNFATNGSVATMAASAAGDVRTMLLPVGLLDTTVYLKFRTNVTPTGNDQYVHLLSRKSADGTGGDEYIARVLIQPDNTMDLAIHKREAGTISGTLANTTSAATFVVNDWYWLKLETYTDAGLENIDVTLWKDGTVEPVSPQVFYQDSTPSATLELAGGVGVRSQLATGYTAGATTFTYDDLIVLTKDSVAGATEYRSYAQAQAAILFTDGFETNNTSRWNDIVTSGVGFVQTESGTAAKTGTYGLAIFEAVDSAGPVYIRKNVAATDTILMEGEFYTESEGPGGNNNANMRLFSGATRIVDVYRQNATGDLWLRTLNSGSTHDFTTTAFNASLDTWYKFTVFVSFAGASSTIIVKVNDVAYINDTFDLLQGAFTIVQLGAEHNLQYVDTYSDNIYIKAPAEAPTGATSYTRTGQAQGRLYIPEHLPPISDIALNGWVRTVIS